MSKDDDDDFTDAFSTIKPAANPTSSTILPADLKLTDFWAYAPTRQYLYWPCNTLWVASFIDSYFPPQPVLDKNGAPRKHAGKIVTVPASKRLDRDRRIDQLIWAPNEPQVIEGRLLDKGGWKRHPGARCYNQYQAPRIEPGDAHKATRWTEHLRRIYPNDFDHIVRWYAHRVQRPGEKINHALVLGGPPQIGKDTLLEAVKHGVGHWNWHEVTSLQLIGRTTEFLKSIVLRVNEARDLGESGRVDRYGFYDHCKHLLATPPNTVRVNEKYVREYYIDNVVGLVVTTNYRDALYLPHDDRRHYVAFSECKASEFSDDYWPKFWSWYHNEDGFAHVTAYLQTIDLSGFDPKASPRKTAAFLTMADSGAAPEEADLMNVIDAIGNPPALTIAQLVSAPNGGSLDWLLERKSRRTVPHWLERCGYLSQRNPAAKDGLWPINERRQVIYVREELSLADRREAARKLYSQSEDITTHAKDGP
jgi:hypothetical protein